MRRRGRKKGVLVYTGLFWTLLFGAALFFTGEAMAEVPADGGETLGKQYLADSFLTINREGGGWDRLQGTETGSEEGSAGNGPVDPEGENEAQTGENTEGEGAGQAPDSAGASGGAKPEIGAASVPLLSQTSQPVVLIYHTHASESYQPYTESNFHREGTEGTVREAGNILTEALEKKGIKVIHDVTLHDRPSYDQSYSRSLETAKTLLQKYPSVELVIDLHRDAAAYSGNSGHVFSLANGGKAAQFALVVGQGNGNAAALNAFAKEIHQLANRLYPGFSRGIIEKDYRYNQYISDCHLLLELGNNQNSIEDIRTSAALFADVIETWLSQR
ncbi:MAG: hypothetical protein E7223_04850 [Clostridiales bacterium]|nr:hypothetical protein [Clostridiales bacterium]